MNEDAPESKVVSQWRISCDGGEGALGHPRVFLQISGEHGWVECPYCDARFVHADFAAQGTPGTEPPGEER